MTVFLFLNPPKISLFTDIAEFFADLTIKVLWSWLLSLWQVSRVSRSQTQTRRWLC